MMKLYSQISAAIVALVMLAGTAPAFAGKTYTEDEFINNFSGKPKKLVLEKLGEPVRKQQSVKPSNANNMVPGIARQEKNAKPVKVEMWYYKNLVRYDDKHTYKETEVTFVNDKVMNIGYFNNR